MTLIPNPHTYTTHTPHTHSHTQYAEVAQSVEHQLPKLRVAGPSPVFRSKGCESNLFLFLNKLYASRNNYHWR
jgi:hypothetical protein